MPTSMALNRKANPSAAGNVPEAIFVDTGAWVALSVTRNAHHIAAKAAWSRMAADRVQLVVSNYVVDEAITTVRAIAGHAQAVKLGQLLFESRVLRRVTIDEVLEQTAWELFQRYRDQAFSFTDCTSFSLMKQEGIATAFTFDRDFKVAGFQLLP